MKKIGAGAGNGRSLKNRRRSGGRGSRRASWGKDSPGFARKIALRIFSQLPFQARSPHFMPKRVGAEYEG
ncbi:MAG: hypothetical protein DMG06_01640 [Acidobacteria bacterium]|nr:MAG: hypothetical protein DMG06_01640 [Acidobacteriota bacterium]